MSSRSDRKQEIRELFAIYQRLAQDDFEQSVMSRSRQSLGQESRTMDLYAELCRSEREDVSLLLQRALAEYYDELREDPVSHEADDLAQLLKMPDREFKQSLRTTKKGFVYLLGEISSHAVFTTSESEPQLPVPHQVALTLERLGSKGSDGSVGKVARNLGVGRRTVNKVTTRVIEAIVSLEKKYIKWPDNRRRAEISRVMKQEGFEGCVGLVHGTRVPLHKRPGIDGGSYLDQNLKYSINVQIICDCDKNIISFFMGWPGSCSDNFVFNKMKIMRESDRFFDKGQYLLADSAYELSKTVIPAYKTPEAHEQSNAEFNHCIARSRVRIEETVEGLKTRFASLKEIQIHILEKKHMQQIIAWTNTCIILHNMLAELGDSWEDLSHEGIVDEENLFNMDPQLANSASQGKEIFLELVKEKCLSINHSKGVLPLQPRPT